MDSETSPWPALSAFCPRCGAAEIAGGDGPFPLCARCGFSRRRFPLVGVAVVVRDDAGRVLLGRRAHGAWAGLWCIPCGAVEWDEHVRDAAERELLEETGLQLRTREVIAVHSNFHQPERHSVGIWFAGEVMGGRLHPGDGENSELAYFDPASPPNLAFPTDALVLAQLAVG
ncbi:MAG: NUDIX domain-containing protein [Dehalococcoidia bacterium]